MGLLSFLQRQRGADKKAPIKAPSADEVQRARTRARQRLIGAFVLLGIGVVAFPLVFETQPRPIPVDIPIEIPRKEGAPPLVAPAPRPKPAAPASTPVITEAAADAGRDVAPAAAASAPEPAREVVAKAAPKPAPPEAARAKAPPEDKPQAKADEGRFVVQVGAFADAGAARETRIKVEKLGLKTYTQVIETDAGKRIRVRVGPFGSREEADKAAGKIKSAGLPSAILGL
jgi:DedD protein